MIKQEECIQIQNKMQVLFAAMSSLDVMLFVAQGNAAFAKEQENTIWDLVSLVAQEAERVSIDFDLRGPSPAPK